MNKLNARFPFLRSKALQIFGFAFIIFFALFVKIDTTAQAGFDTKICKRVSNEFIAIKQMEEVAVFLNTRWEERTAYKVQCTCSDGKTKQTEWVALSAELRPLAEKNPDADISTHRTSFFGFGQRRAVALQ